VLQGICPGNRLRLLAGVYDTGQLLADSPELLELNTLQRQGKRRSWHVQPNKVSATSYRHVFGQRYYSKLYAKMTFFAKIV